MQREQVEPIEKRRASALRRARRFLLGVVFCSVLRFIAPLNDALSGHFRPMKAVARDVGYALAESEHGAFPVVVTDQKIDCQQTQNAGNPKAMNEMYFVVTYSEEGQWFCILGYVDAADSKSPAVLVLGENLGTNLGASIPAPMKVVPVMRYLKVFPDDRFISLLHWRTRIKRSGPDIHFRTLESYSDSLPEPVNINADYNIYRIRKGAAFRHDILNAALDATLFLFVVGAIIQAENIRSQYSCCRSELARYGRRLSLQVFLRGKPGDLLREAQQDDRREQQQEQERLRAEKASRRSEEEMRRRLLSFLAVAADDQQRRQIQECLDSGDLQEMEGLLDELERQPRQKNVSERLALLLESLKEYCADSEIEQYREEAFKVLESEGFREARALIVRLHEDCRKRARELEEGDNDGYGPE